MRKIAIAMLIASLLTAAFGQEQRISELKSAIELAEKKGNVDARSIINQYWQLADIYLAQGDKKAAYQIIKKALQLDSWNYKYQMIAAEMEFENGQYAQAQNRAEFIMANIAELKSIYDESVTLKKKIDDLSVGKPASTENPYLPGYSIYIATYPYVDSDLIDYISGRISEEYGLQVKVVSMGVDESELNIRNKQLTAYEEIIADVMSRYPETKIDEYLRDIGLSRADLESSDGKRKLVFALLGATEQGRSQWQNLEIMAKQYSANALLAQISGTLAEYGKEKRSFGVLGITRNDIYESDYNFLFGYARKTWGVMSYSRFSMGNPGTQQFQKRAVMQAMSSVGLILGIPRCTNPACARAYPNSLEEQDRKNDALCEDCRKKTVQLYAQYQGK